MWPVVESVGVGTVRSYDLQRANHKIFALITNLCSGKIGEMSYVCS